MVFIRAWNSSHTLPEIFIIIYMKCSRRLIIPQPEFQKNNMRQAFFIEDFYPGMFIGTLQYGVNSIGSCIRWVYNEI